MNIYSFYPVLNYFYWVLSRFTVGGIEENFEDNFDNCK